MESASATLLATDHELFVGDLIDQMRKQRQEKSRSYRHLPYFQHLGSEEVFEALDRVRQANLLQMQLKMQKDCSYLQHMDDMSLEGRNAENVRKRVQEGKLQGGFRQVQSQGHTTVCGCLDCQLRLGNKQFNSSFQYEQSKEALAQKVQRSKVSFLGAAWHGKSMLAMHLVNEGGAPDAPGTAVHAAVLRGDAELVRLLCGRGECDTGTTWHGVTALDLAVFKGFDDGGDVLLQHGAPLKHFQHESLAEAVDRGSMLLLRALLQQIGLMHQALNCPNAEGNTPLHLACLLPEREAAVKILVAHNAEYNKENAEGMTPLDCCVHTSNRGSWRTLRHATAGQAKYRRYEQEQRSLRAAVAANCLFLVRNIHLRQDEDKKSEKTKTDLGDILHLAVSAPGISDDMVQYLVEQGADVNALKDGMTVLDACLLHNNVNESLLGRHARLGRFQDYTLSMAVKEGRTGLVRYLTNSARKSSKDALNHREAGCLPLHLAASRGLVDVVKVLLKGNSNVHEQTDDGKTPLDLACEELSKLAGGEPFSESHLGLCKTIEALLSRGCKLKEFSGDSLLERAKECVQRDLENPCREDRERDEVRTEMRRQVRKRREDCDEALRQVEREIRASVAEEERKAEAYKESEKLAKKVSESREVLQASWKGEGDKLPEYLSSKYYQIRIDVLRRKIQEKDQQIEDALKKMDFAEEDYLWLLRKKMRDLRLRYHPDKITDRSPNEEDYKFYERITKAYDVLCTKEERDKYLEMSNHVEWLQQHGEEEEARLVEKAIYDMETQKKGKKDEKKDEESAQPPPEHVERAKKKLQERREEETWEKSGEKIKALTLGTPNKCKAPVVTAHRYSDRLEQCWIDIEWVCKCAYASAERIEYELRVQAIDKGADIWADVYNGWESSVPGLGPFQIGTYEFMVRAKNSIGWGEWSDVVVVTLDDPKWEKQQRKEAGQQILRDQAKGLQCDLQQILDDFEDTQGESKLTIHRATNLLFHLQAELKRSRTLRSYMQKPALLREAEAAVRVLEQWRDRKEAFAEWKQQLSEMKTRTLQEVPVPVGDRGDCCDLPHFLGQDKHYFGSLSPEIRNLIVQTLLGLDTKQVFKRLTPSQKDSILSVLRRGVELGRTTLPPSDRPEESNSWSTEKARTIFTKHQTEQLQRLVDRFAGAHCRTPTSPSALQGEQDLESETAAEAASPMRADGAATAASRAQVSQTSVASPTSISPVAAAPAAPAAPPAAAPCAPPTGVATEAAPLQALGQEAESAEDRQGNKDRGEKRLRTVHVVGLPHREHISRGDLLGALRPFAEVDGARVGTTDALVRFSTPEEAKSALSALEQGCVALRRSILSGHLAGSDSLTEEALLKAGGKPPPEKRPVPAKGAPTLQPQRRAPQPPQPPLDAHGRLDAQRQEPHPEAQPVHQHVSRQQQHLRGGLTANLPLHVATDEALHEARTGDQHSRAGDQHRHIGTSQLENRDGSNNMFECPLCTGVVWHPKVTMCCQKLFCSHCLDSLLQKSTACPQCHASLVVSDGSTGGCTEQRVKRLDRNSTGVQAVLWRVYGNLRIHCEHECGWTGNIIHYGEHISTCRQEADKSRVPEEGSSVHVIVWEHKALDESQLTLRVGDRVTVQQVAAHGWVYGQRLPGSHAGSKEGWFPSFCLPERRPPRPQQSPPPSAPPAGSTRVVRDYEASDKNQLSVKMGEWVCVRQRDQSGWTFVVRVNAQGSGSREGWVPDWLLQGETVG